MSLYTSKNYARVAFPLGGIGTGGINLAGNGALTDCSFYNMPARHTPAYFSSFAVKAERDGELIDARFLNGDYTVPDYDNFSGRKWVLGCVKHFENCEFRGEFPFAQVKFTDRHFPGEVSLDAFNPFIPSNYHDSSIPAAFFTVKFKNTSDKPTEYTTAFSFTNLLHKPGEHRFLSERKYPTVTMESYDGTQGISLATDCEDYAYQEYWFRPSEYLPFWLSFDRIRLFFGDFAKPGKIKNRHYSKPKDQIGIPDTATVTASVKLAPGEEKEMRFVLSWYVPYYKKTKNDSDDEILKNYYTTMFESSADVAEYCFENRTRLYNDTKAFKDTLFSSNMPEEVIDAIQANLATLKTPTCLRDGDGHFWGWEGMQDDDCYGTCQHVWNYAYALPFLFPKLEKQLRVDEFHYSLSKEGRMNFRMPLPMRDNTAPINGTNARMLSSCIDGQMGSVMKTYREWKISGDNEWLAEQWSSVKKCLEFAWSKDNTCLWDPERSGVITGRQHNTLDIEVFGVHAWLTGLYHGALLAGAQMADAMGEPDTARDYLELYRKGHEWLEENTFNGEYYVQHLDLNDKKILDPYDPEAIKMYWNEELSEICFQLGDACEIDQVLADFHASLMGLPEVFDHAHRVSALKALYRYNFMPMRELVNSCRIFASNDEKGLIMCSWPEGAKKPESPIMYSEECMTGFEYAAACNMLICGMEKEALEIVRAVRERYDGEKRNPWSEIECGASYARAMSSYAFLLAYSGFKYDMTKNCIGFKPIRNGKYFWSVDGAWGSAEISETELNIRLLYGEIKLNRIITPFDKITKTALNGSEIDFTAQNETAVCDADLQRNDLLTVYGLK